jgi:hypothetical protein
MFNALKHKPGLYKGLIALVCGVLMLLSGCVTQSKELEAILESSVLTASLTTGSQVRRFVQDKRVTLGKPMPAEVMIIYEPKDVYTQKDVFDEIVGFLEKDTWEKKDLSIPRPEYYTASLLQQGFLISAEVSISSDSNTVVLTLRAKPR